MQSRAPTTTPATPRASGPITIGLLGPFRVGLPDGPVIERWTRPPARRLVAVLALTPGRRLSRDALAEQLFPGLAATPASRALAKALSMARATLERPTGRAVFSVDRAAIGLVGDDLVVDLDQLEAGLRAGLEQPASARIGLLAPLVADRRVLLEDDPYEDWAIEARERLETLRAAARVGLARALDSTGAPAADRCLWWRSVTDEDPADEGAWVAQIRAELDAGRKDRALRASYQARAALREELDAEPGAELRDLHHELLAAQQEAPTSSAETAAERSTFGRDPILAELNRLVADLVRGRGRDLCLVGQAGIGKTHLLNDAADLARGHAIVGRGASVAEDRRVPYASLRQALQDLPLEWVRLKPRLARLLGRDRVTGSVPASHSAQDLASLTEEIVAVLEQLAEDRPVLLVLDDVQWVDPALQSVLQRLVATPPRRRWALLTAARSGGDGGSMPSSLGAIVTVPRLTDESIADVVRHAVDHAPDGSSLRRTVDRSAGNPLFALELARAGPGGDGTGDVVPERIAGVIGRRFTQRSPAARRVLPILALGDETIANDVILAVMPDEVDLLDVLDELQAASLVQPVEGGLRLAHPLIREAAAELVNPIRRARIHRGYADAIDGLVADRSDLELSAVRHRVAAWEAGRLAEDAGPAALAAWRGARIADEAFSADAARDLLEAGLAAWDAAPPPVRRSLGDGAGKALVRLGELALDENDEPGATAWFERALALELGDEPLAAAWSALGGVPYRRGDMAGAAAIYRRGLAALADPVGVPAARLRSTLGWALWRADDPDAVALVTESAAVLAEHGAPEQASRALDRLAIMAPDVDAALDASDRAFVHLQRASDRRELGTLLVHRAVIERRAGRLAAAMRSSDEALTLFRAAGDGYMESVCLWTRADVLEANEDLPGALAARDEEARILSEIDNPRNLAGCHTHRARLLRRLGRPDEAADASRASIVAAERSGDPNVLATATAAASEVALPA